MGFFWSGSLEDGSERDPADRRDGLKAKSSGNAEKIKK